MMMNISLQHQSLLLSGFLLLSFLCLSASQVIAREDGDRHVLHNELRLRQHAIKRFAQTKVIRFPRKESAPPLEKSGMDGVAANSAWVDGVKAGVLQCPADRFVKITEFSFGRTGNHMIEFAHGLFIAEQLNATLIVPAWIVDIFDPFDTHTLNALYCWGLDVAPKASAKVFEVTSEEAFFPFQLYRNEEYQTLLPSMSSEDFLSTLSLHFLHVYSALWSSPRKKLLSATEQFIYHHLDGNFKYNAVHKRRLEGGCSSILGKNTAKADYSASELPMHHSEWTGNLVERHPLCEMTYSFVSETLQLHHRNGSRLFVAFDGQGAIDDFQAAHSVFSSQMLSQRKVDVDAKFLDMLIAIHADFFVLNPRSTFSFQVFAIRLVLSLLSVPMVKNNDVYLMKVPEDLTAGKRPLWVSWYSLYDAMLATRR